MTHYSLFVLIISLLILVLKFNVLHSQTIEVFSLPDYKGLKKTVNVTNCSSSFGFENGIESVKTKGNCIHLYWSLDCQFNYVILKGDLSRTRNANNLMQHCYLIDNSIKSVKACAVNTTDNTCSSNYNSSSMFARPIHVRLGKERKDNERIYDKIDVTGCLPIPLKFKRDLTIVQPNNTYPNECIVVYSDYNCTVPVYKLEPRTDIYYGYYLQQSFANGNSEESDICSKTSISQCGFNCNRGKALTQKQQPNSSVITVFDGPHYLGNKLAVNVSNGLCTNLSKEWEQEVQSIETFGNCLIVYESFACSNHSIRLDRTNEGIHGLLESVGFRRRIRSVKQCEKEAGKEEEYGYETSTVMFVAAAIGVVILPLVCALSTYLCYGRENGMCTKRENANPDPIKLAAGGGGRDFCFAISLESKYEINRDQLFIDWDSMLGTGQYAVVYRGVVKSLETENGGKEVAVKTLKPFAEPDYIRALLGEISVMIRIGNSLNVVNLVGCCTENFINGELFVITDICENGSLETYVRRNRKIFVDMWNSGSTFQMEKPSTKSFNTVHLLQWSLQIAQGMQYLASKNVIHGDLSARNVLLDDQFVAKVADFGLSRKLYQHTQYIKKNMTPLPWKWLSIEALTRMEFSTESDVWAYGITIWELFSLGDTPYCGCEWGQSFIRSLNDGFRLPNPLSASTECYNLMLACWDEEPADRISFAGLRFKLLEMLDHISGHLGYSGNLELKA